MGSFDVSTSRGTTLANLNAEGGFLRPATDAKTPSFKAPKTIGRKPVKIVAGGPGSGRRPGWRSTSKNHDKLNEMHDKLIQKGYTSHGFTQRNNYAWNAKPETKDREHQYSKTNADGGYRGATIYERKNGDHALSHTDGPGGKWAKQQVVYDHQTSSRKY